MNPPLAKLSSLLCVALLAASCGREAGSAAVAEDATTSATAADVEADERAIRELNNRWIDAARARDTDGLVALYAEDAVVYEPGMPDGARGRDAVREYYEGYLGMEGLEVSGSPTEIRVARAGDLAYEIGDYTFAAQTPQGPISDEGRYLSIWEKRDGQWRISREVSHSKRPPPGAGQP